MSANFTHCCPSNTSSFLIRSTAKSPLSFKLQPKAHFGHGTGSKDDSSEYTNKDSSSLSKTFLDSTPVPTALTAPWMSAPIVHEPNQITGISEPSTSKDFNFRKNDRPEKVLVDKVSGGRGKRAMKKIFQGIQKLRETKDSQNIKKYPESFTNRFSPGGLWSEESCSLEPVDRKQVSVPPGEFGLDIPVGEIETGEGFEPGKKMPWEKDEKIVFRRVRKQKVMTAAELNLDLVLLKKLRAEAAKMKRWVKVKKAGVSDDVVDQIHSIWKGDELVMLKFDLPLYRNMGRAREIVEMKTGGLVVWSKKDTLVVYRGCNHQLSMETLSNIHHELSAGQESSQLNISCQDTVTSKAISSDGSRSEDMMISDDSEEDRVEVCGSLYEREADRLLDGLGPRFVDWWWRKPLPVDADMLPEVVPGFKPPFRLCPPGVQTKLTDDELTQLRMLARPLPTHFVLGRNRKLQGLAVAILKLWEKCHIAKIAIKWGIPNTDNEQVADELKFLTGGILLLRNKFIIILYRGKDFLPSKVANLVVGRELELTRCQVLEEAARLKASEIVPLTDVQPLSSTIGTLSEFENIQSESLYLENGTSRAELKHKAEKERLEKELRSEQRKLIILRKKIEISGKELEKLNFAWQPSELAADQEIITEEERECLRKIGLKMDRSLVLGRRGVFDGVIEGLHQHWKHREVVKVITMQRRLSQVVHTTDLLVAESGGVLVSIDKLKEGHAIIIYRGKNYSRPKLIGNNLLNKRDALHRSLLLQRIGSLKYFARQREQAISNIKHNLAELESGNEQIDHSGCTS